MTVLSVLLSVALNGFAFGLQQAPTGLEWNDPQQLSLNKELPSAWFFSFSDEQSARGVLPECSSLWQSLDGDWKFHWCPQPSERPADFYVKSFDDSSWDTIQVPSNWNIAGLGDDGSQKYGTPIYVNVDVPWFFKREPDDWRLGVMREPPHDWTAYAARNEVGSYRRTFTLPEAWAGKRIFIDFDGVDSFFYLWVNGRYVGFSKNSRNCAKFDITDFVDRGGENVIAVEVYRYSDAANLEAQDMFRLPGIFRTVALEARSEARFRDLRVNPSLKALEVEAELAGCGEGCSIDYSLYECALYSDDNEPVAAYPGCGTDACLELEGAKPWSAEAPHRYVLVAKLKDAEGRIQDIVSTYAGFRTVEILDTPAELDEFGLAGRYFYVNGKPVKLRGVNRHETEPSAGHAVTRAMMEEDVRLMKRANINHVRDSHYPDAPYWYYLCDKWGIYLMDEANLESHHYHYGEASLSHPAEWRDAHVARVLEMMAQNYNHPSIVVWSMGNEAGPGENFLHAYNRAKQFDPGRPVQYERNNDYSDIGCRQYPEVSWVEHVATGTADVKYPYHINEFAHSMGNALGNFADYWKYINSTNFFMGGAIWDWVDQSLWNHTADGTRYLATGGDFGDKPNSGQFVANGLLFGDREPKPQYFEVKKVYQPLQVCLSEDGRGVDLFNMNYFEPVCYDIDWQLLCDGRVIRSGRMDMEPVPARSRASLELPCGDLPDGRECRLNLSFCQKEDLLWAEAGYEVCREQLLLQKGSAGPVEAEKAFLRGKSVRMSASAPLRTLRGRGFRLVMNDTLGTIHSLRYRLRPIIKEGCGPELDVFRAFVNNDSWIAGDWAREGLPFLRTACQGSPEVQTLPDGGIALTYELVVKAPCSSRMNGSTASCSVSLEQQPEKTDVVSFRVKARWTVHPDGSVQLDSDIDCDKPRLTLPRIGWVMQTDRRLSHMIYWGRGPRENYPDRWTDSFDGVYSGEVADQVTNYTKPQDMSNHEQVRWVRLTRRSGRGAEFAAVSNSLCSSDSGAPVMSVSAVPWNALDMLLAQHPYQLPETESTYLHLDAAVTGLGGASCGPAPLENDRVCGKAVFGFVIRPI